MPPEEVLCPIVRYLGEVAVVFDDLLSRLDVTQGHALQQFALFLLVVNNLTVGLEGVIHAS